MSPAADWTDYLRANWGHNALNTLRAALERSLHSSQVSLSVKPSLRGPGSPDHLLGLQLVLGGQAGHRLAGDPAFGRPQLAQVGGVQLDHAQRPVPQRLGCGNMQVPNRPGAGILVP